MSLDFYLLDENGDYLDDHDCDDEEVFEQNITHNLKKMAREAGVIDVLWYPGDIRATHAKEAVDPLKKGLAKLKASPDYFKKFNPPNGWGTYAGFVRAVENCLRACRQYPEAKIEVSI